MASFEEETAVTRVAENHYRGELCEGWRVGAVPNGGYVLAIAGRALREALPHNDPLSVNAFYLAPTALGPIDCHVQLLRVGKGTSFAEVRMEQEGELKVKVTAAYTDLANLSGENWQLNERPEFPAWEECESSGQKVEYSSRVELRLVRGQEVFRDRAPNGTGEFCGWVQLRDGSDPTAISLLTIADAMPPPVLTLYGPVGWVPTVELTVQVRAHPAPGPVQCRLATRYLTEGVVEEDGEYWDSSGKLVALSRQTAKFRLPKKS